MIILCQNKEQIVNLNNLNSLYIEKKSLNDYRSKYFLKADIETKAYILGTFFTEIACKNIFDEIVDNYLNYPEIKIYKVPETDKSVFDYTRKSAILDLSEL